MTTATKPDYRFFTPTEAPLRPSLCEVSRDSIRIITPNNSEESFMEKLYRHRCERREAAIRRLVERVLSHEVPAGLEELAWLALVDMGVRVEVVLCNCATCADTVFAHRGSTCIDSEPIDYRAL